MGAFRYTVAQNKEVVPPGCAVRSAECAVSGKPRRMASYLTASVKQGSGRSQAVADGIGQRAHAAIWRPVQVNTGL